MSENQVDARAGIGRRGLLAAVTGYGTSWYVDPVEEMIAILMSQRVWDATTMAFYGDFWTSAYQAIDD